MATVRSIRAKAGSKSTTILTACGTSTASIISKMGIGIVLVGNNIGNTALGYDSTLPVTVGDVADRTAVVTHATDDALVVAGTSFLSVGMDETSSIECYGWMLKEANANAVKPKCGPHIIELTKCLVRLSVPVMVHLGLMLQRAKEVNYDRQDTDRDDTQEILDLAKAHVEAGAFSLTLERVPASLTKQVTGTIDVPTIGIGTNSDCNGQVLVVGDAVGMSDHTPPSVTRFDDAKPETEKAAGAYRGTVETGEFPADGHSHIEGNLDELY